MNREDAYDLPPGRDGPHPHGASEAQRPRLPAHLASAPLTVAAILSGAVGLAVFG